MDGDRELEAHSGRKESCGSVDHAALVYTVLCALLLVMAPRLVAALGSRYWLVAALALWTAMVGLPLIGAALRHGRIRPVAFGKVTRRGLLLAVVGPILFLFCGQALAILFLLVIRSHTTSLETNTGLRWLGSRMALGRAGFILLLSPFPEEFFWRGFVYGRFRRRLGGLVGGLSQAVLFGLSHFGGGLYHVWSGFLYGLGFGWVYERSRSLVCAVLSHLLVNGAVFCLLCWAGPPGSDFEAQVLKDLSVQIRDPQVIAAQREIDEAADERGPKGIAKLISFLGDSRSAVPGYALGKIVQTYGKEAGPYLRSALAASTSTVQQDNLILTLEVVRDPSAREAVAPFVNSDAREVRLAAVSALLSFGDVDYVLGGLESGRAEVRESTFGVLQAKARGENFGYDPRLPPEQQPEAIAEWRSWLGSRSERP